MTNSVQRIQPTVSAPPFRRRAGLSRLILLSLVLCCAATSLSAEVPGPRDTYHRLWFELAEAPSLALPPLPDPETFPVQLVIDDDGLDGVFGLTGGTARQFLWFNQFTSPGSGFDLQEIWVLFPSSMDVPVGGAIEIVVYLDDDNDPSNGATLLASYDEVIQAADDQTFSVYPIPNLEINQAGDVLIGVVNRYYETGVDPPPTLPAAVDTDSNQNRSYFALWAGDPPVAPDLTTATLVDVLDGAASGNFMIRGFGTGSPAVEIPTLSGFASALLALLLAVLSYGLLAKSRSRAER